MHMRALAFHARPDQLSDQQVRTVPTSAWNHQVSRMLAPAASLKGPSSVPVRRRRDQRKTSGRTLAAGAAHFKGQLDDRIRAPATPVQEQEDVEYKDSWTDIAFIGLCRKAYGNIAGWQSPRDWKHGDETYKGMVEVSKAMMKVKEQFRRLADHSLRQ